ncbi:CDP-glycerol glycerophosphotransferase family protein [Mammaliicoccus sciuri]|uniref:CDP-glycerol glycerophosphotransferase family protein n=1 Tax=Mammaliicoccus sciuri TaxID=1296 RepID=UPI001E3E9A9C|nr:CDP-glycerol glycerophosphotransferase family protein [Mammaliicoccus sciuri]MCD8884409.1 CDP-glycerol glycerophosphotransferase family protein [Mammaliicoccus sciuri]
MNFIHQKGDNLVLKDGYFDANDLKIANGKRRLIYKKFYIYDDNGIVYLDKSTDENIEIIEIFDNSKRAKDTILVVYLDPRNRLSFIITKRHFKLRLEEVIEKAESNPAHKLKTFSFLKNYYITGIIRFRYANMDNVSIALGYDKSLSYEHKYIFSEKIRKKFSESTNKLLLLSQWGYTKIIKKDMLEKYIETSEINLPVYIKSTTKDHLNYYYPLRFNYRDNYNKKHYIYSSKSYKLNDYIEFFLRKSVSGQLVFVMTDKLNKSIKFKEKVARVFSVFGKKEKYDIYFEKFAKNAGESAFELFKKSKEQKDKNSKYILDKENEDFKNLQNLYGKNNVLAHNSFKSFYVIFKARSFVSSDLVTHLQRRLYDNSQLLKKKILSNNNKVFLQHGPSLATNVFERGYFNKKVPICPNYIVTNSKLESDYFKKYPKFNDDELIELGIPNLDLYVNEKENKKEQITFMLTWRPWDLTGKIEENSYIDRYLQFLEVVTNNEFYNDKIINITLHPKARLMIENQFPETYKKLQEYIYEGDIKDALINSKVVITDYSSICFYAFAGGSNVIYFWGDKELAENEYGSPNILQDYNKFGDVVFDIKNSLNNVIQKNYASNQNNLYVENYQKLIEHTDGNNTINVYNYIKSL